jgi:transposase
VVVVSDAGAVNARLRRVVADKDELIAAQAALLENQAAMIQAQSEQLSTQAELIKLLQDEMVELRRRLGQDSTNSSVPPSKDSITAKAKRKADRSSRVRSKDRKPGGQPGRKGVGLTPTADPDETLPVNPASECRSCEADSAFSTVLPDGWAQVWDVLPAVLEKTHYLLPRRRCECGVVTTACPPFGQVGTVSYGPNLNAAAIILGSEGNVPVERTAMLIHSLLGVQVSTGFVARAAERLADTLGRAGFDEAMKAALRGETVLCGDESPVNTLGNDLDENGTEVPGAPHAVTVRTPDARLVWYAGMPARTKTAIADLGVLNDWHGYLVRDDYAGWHQFDPQLAGVQQCIAHIIRHCKGVHELHPNWQKWADQIIGVLRDADTAVTAARVEDATELDPELLADLRKRYDKAVDWGITTNLHRDWHKGNHPGYVLAQRLKDKAEQVWLFTRNFQVPWTNNASEQALRSPKRHQVVSGYWHTTDTLRGYLRVRSYLVSARGHGIRAIDAIHTALTGNPWLPTPITA